MGPAVHHGEALGAALPCRVRDRTPGGDREDNLGTLDAAGARPEARRGTRVEGNLAEAVGLEVDNHVGLWFIS